MFTQCFIIVALDLSKGANSLQAEDLEEEPALTGDQSGPSAPPAPKTAKQLAARRNQERVKSILLLAIPDEYLLKFHNVADAKSLWEAIKSRFGGNVESKKMQKNVHGAPISKEDINQKFLRSLPSSWNQIALIMRNKPDIDEIDIDDLYNNRRVYKDELKSTASGDFGVSTAGGINQVPSTPCAHDVAYSFLAQPTTSPQLENEDFQMGGLAREDCRLARNLGRKIFSVTMAEEQCTNKMIFFTEHCHLFFDVEGNFLTPRADISFAGLDEYAIRNKIIESQTTELNTKTSETAGQTNVEKPKSANESVVSNPKINRDRVIIEDWNSYDEEKEYEVQTVRPETQTDEGDASERTFLTPPPIPKSPPHPSDRPIDTACPISDFPLTTYIFLIPFQRVLVGIMKVKMFKLKKHEVKQVQQSCLGEDCWELFIPDLVPLVIILSTIKAKRGLKRKMNLILNQKALPKLKRNLNSLLMIKRWPERFKRSGKLKRRRKGWLRKKLQRLHSLMNMISFRQDLMLTRYLLEKLQEEEREMYTIEQRTKFLHDTIAAQRRFLAQQRSEAIRNKPPTRNQPRNQMMTYLKHVGGKKHSDLKNKSFDEIQVLYEKIKRSDDSFIAIGSAEDEKVIKEMNEQAADASKKRVKKDDSVKGEIKAEKGTKKRKSGHVKMIARKRPRPQPDDDSDDEHKRCLRMATFEGTIDSKIMETKSFIARLHKVSSPDGNYLVVYRVNGHFRAFNYLMEVLHIFDRQDLFHLYDLVMKQYSEITPKDIELILWGDLKIMMESSTEENDQGDFWNNQQEWEIVRWRLYEACGVCILELKDGTVIYMLVERRYPLSKELLQQMIDLGLEVEEESTAALQLGSQLTLLHSKELASPGSNSSWLSIHLVVYNEELAIPEQTATGKGISNPLMAGSLPKTTKPT
ncbi:hypothetical protein Tco_1361674 [Tanacetum coccineum]